jgi:hypothetical protein
MSWNNNLVRGVPMEQLKEAEAAELEMVGESRQELGPSEEDRFQREMDATRFIEV